MSTVEADRAIQAELVLGDELAQYAGEWVAVYGHHVVAHANTLRELSDQIEQEEIEAEGAFQVPTGDATSCFF